MLFGSEKIPIELKLSVGETTKADFKLVAFSWESENDALAYVLRNNSWWHVDGLSAKQVDKPPLEASSTGGPLIGLYLRI